MYCYGHNFQIRNNNDNANKSRIDNDEEIKWLPGFTKTYVRCLIFIPLIFGLAGNFFIHFELSVWPALIIMGFVAKQSMLNKQSKGLILELLLKSAYATFLETFFAAYFVDRLIEKVAAPESQLYFFLISFIRAALIEETMKYYILHEFTWNREEFNHRYAAVVFAVAVGTGFAIMENLDYAFFYGLKTVLGRIYTATPAHCAFGVIMGWLYGLAKIRELHGDKLGCKVYKVFALLFPVIIHGAYDYLFFAQYTAIFYLLIFAICIFSLYKVKNLARKDALIWKYDLFQANKNKLVCR